LFGRHRWRNLDGMGNQDAKADAELLATEWLDELRQLSYAELQRQAGPRQVEQVTGLSGGHYQRRTQITRVGRGQEVYLHIRIQVVDGRAGRGWAPLAEVVVTAWPDGEFLHEHTLLAERGGERRRYASLGPWPWVMAGLLVVLIVVVWWLRGGLGAGP
jgi:hypothetical protein